MRTQERPAVMVAGAGQYIDEQSGEPPRTDVIEDVSITSSDDASTARALDEVALVRKATEVLGNDHVARWMRSNIPSLGNQTPYALLKTEEGRKQVERVLLKIEHGVY